MNSKKIIEGLELAYERLVAFKKLKNSPIIISKDGEIKELDPHQVSPTTKYYEDINEMKVEHIVASKLRKA